MIPLKSSDDLCSKTSANCIPTDQEESERRQAQRLRHTLFCSYSLLSERNALPVYLPFRVTLGLHHKALCNYHISMKT